MGMKIDFHACVFRNKPTGISANYYNNNKNAGTCSGSPENKKIGFGAVGLFSHNNIEIFYVLLSQNIKI